MNESCFLPASVRQLSTAAALDDHSKRRCGEAKQRDLERRLLTVGRDVDTMVHYAAACFEGQRGHHMAF